jgi:hypothetical protein
MELTRQSDPVAAYTNGIDKATNIAELRAVIDEHKEIAFDAKKVADTMTDDDFISFRDGLLSCRKRGDPGYSWGELFEPIVLPAVFTMVTCVAVFYKVPWGIAYGRMLDSGILVVDEHGILRPTGKKASDETGSSVG